MTQTKSASIVAGLKAGIRARKAARRHKPMDPKHIAFVAACIRDLEDDNERAAAMRDFAAVHFATKGKFDQGHVQFGRLRFTAPARKVA